MIQNFIILIEVEEKAQGSRGSRFKKQHVVKVKGRKKYSALETALNVLQLI